MIRAFLLTIALSLSLTACVSMPGGMTVGNSLPYWDEPKQFVLQEVLPDNSQRQYLLIIEAMQPNQLRWLLLDPLGAPISRQTLQNGHWKNDGFVPPAGTAIRNLFLASLSLVLTPAQLQAVLPELSFNRQANGDQLITRTGSNKLWAKVSFDNGSSLFEFNQGKGWRLTLLENL